ncbi:hypothetical protein D0C36_15770 [Mucilaginibacter conchicola]|uniref:Uncharacterized protein n=1 Tax=Mucilaginibacter conchicola TaxID=2303333 RepID=A0A372NUB7_9SPHI|nr:hypothetical protein [Mucilaginibacter conchicola]RFZ92848.1 hypothetical protein D0C36_15770 [Mucilaginibacter conchicola]
MKIAFFCLLSAAVCLLQPLRGRAQQIPASADSALTRQYLHQLMSLPGISVSFLKTDTSKKRLPTVLIKNAADSLRGSLKAALKAPVLTNPLKGLKNLPAAAAVPSAGDLKKEMAAKLPGNAVVSRLNATSKRLSGSAASAIGGIRKKADILKRQPVMFDLALEDAVRYNPVSALTGLSSGDKFINVVSVRGTAAVFGVPLNIDLSTQPRIGATGQMNGNALFKFDLDPDAMKSMLTSEIDEYRKIGASSLAGMNMTDYARSRLGAELTRGKEMMNGKKPNALIAAYLDKPGKMAELLSSSKEQIRNKIMDEATRQGKAVTGAPSRLLPAAALPGLQLLNAKQSELSAIGNNTKLTAYLTSPDNRSALRLMNEEQIAEKIRGLQYPEDKEQLPEYHYNALTGQSAFDLDAFLSAVSRSRQAGRESAVKDAAKALMIAAKQDNVIDPQRILSQERAGTEKQIAGLAGMNYLPLDRSSAGPAARVALSYAERLQLGTQADSIAASIAGLKQELSAKGIDVDRLLTVQALLEKEGDGQGMTEYARSLYTRGPSGMAQGLLSKFSALKLGSFSNQPSSLVKSQDVLMQGGHVTLNTGRYPLTAGYGTVTDLNSAKDAGFNASVFNQQRRITYLGTEIRNPVSGGLKFTVIGSVGGGLESRNYALPSISGNNVAMTVSKMMKMGKAGDLDLDVSRSTTLFSNKYQIGTDLLLDRKAGMNYDAAADLFSAMSFGAAHHLDLPGQGLSEDVYVSYSGTGYQNPGTSGPGGARTKFGGNFRKAFMDRKLQVTLRSDFNNQPISFTSDDRWKTRQFQFDGRYQMSRKLNFTAKYTMNNTDKRIDGVSDRVYGFNKLQFGANANYKIGKYLSVSRLLLSGQSLNSGGAAVTPGTKMFMMNYMQSVVLDQNVLTANVFYNKELATASLIGDMLNADASLQYKLSKRLGLSSGLTYLSNSNTARQAGIRQNLTYRANERFNISAFVDARKNLIRPLYPDLYAACRAELSLQYRINY